MIGTDDPGERRTLLNAEGAPATILIAIDGSGGASRIIAAGARLARLNPMATVHVAHVFRTSRELKIDLLVVGTHDHEGVERFLLGSIAETLVRRAPCSVYVVRPTAYRE